ncbi:MAG: copper resistance protein CopC [Pseudochelatococcus sp.]|jgi:copper transport protein|uniref:copper resistance CopC/CopD family protein n=1 Tax=Pseudochelatococcus sp. TaxID=2020869 RepID=UPI003D8E38D6
MPAILNRPHWFLVALLLMLPLPAFAHAVLTGVSPAENAVLDVAPDAALLSFNEPVSPLSIRLIGPDGSDSDLTRAVSGARELRIPFAALARGTHVLTWRVASDDGHPVAGSLVFSIGVATGAAAVAASDPLVAGLLWAARFLMSAGLLLGIGGALFGALAGLPAEARRPVRGLIWLGLLTTPLALGLHGADALGTPVASLLTPAPWAAGAATSFGRTTALAMIAAGLALTASRVKRLAFAAVAVLAAAYASSGHASAAAPQWMTRPAVFLHVAALSFWLGALLPLTLWLRRRDGAAALKRFSDIIPFAVVPLAGSGLALALVQLGPRPDGWSTAYGAILAAKLALLALLLTLAAWNRWFLTAPALRGAAVEIRRLRVVVGTEIVLAIAILGLAAGWRFTPPPRALAQAAALPAAAHLHIHTSEVMADITVTPGTAGPATVEIVLSDGDMLPLTPLGVVLGASRPDRGIERMTHEATLGADGIWRIDDLVLPLPGVWRIGLDVRLGRFSLAKLSGEIDIK